MLQHIKLNFLFFILAFLQSCNTIFNTTTTKIEILIPGSVTLSPDYKKVAFIYNNSNISENENFSYYYEDNNKLRDTFNTDSIASLIYFEVATEQLKDQYFFDTIYNLQAVGYSLVEINDSLVNERFQTNNTAGSVDIIPLNTDVYRFTEMLKRLSENKTYKPVTKYIDPDFGLFSKHDIGQIADSTHADLLISLDYFAVTDGIFTTKYYREFLGSMTYFGFDIKEATEVVYVYSNWSFYDLQNQKHLNSIWKTDTIQWYKSANNLSAARRLLPPRHDAVCNAADIAGRQFAGFLAPQWIEVERMYYKCGQGEMKKTGELVKQHRWLEAAEIWKKNSKTANKTIAAKSMYNLALACEMNGELNAAIDWLVKSFYVFGSKNQFHAINCRNYIDILARRKLDIQKIEGDIGNN